MLLATLRTGALCPLEDTGSTHTPLQTSYPLPAIQARSEPSRGRTNHKQHQVSVTPSKISLPISVVITL